MIKYRKSTTLKICTARNVVKESTRGTLMDQTLTGILPPSVKNASSKVNTCDAWTKKRERFGRLIKYGTVRHVKMSYLKVKIATIFHLP